MNSKVEPAERVSEECKGVFDSSAVLAWLLNEPGGTAVEAALPGLISAVNLTEVVIVSIRNGLPAGELAKVISELPLEVVSFELDQVLPVASLHNQTRQHGLSLADCVCVSLGAKRNLPVYTADSAWAEVTLPANIRLIR